MAFTLSPLPYDHNALAPYVSQQTLELHHGKHNNTYVVNLNNLIKDSALEDQSIENIILDSANNPEKVGIFNNSGQILNHKIYWDSMSPNGGGKPTGDFEAKINSDFGSYDDFASAFTQAATTQFGSGWAWLISDKGTLKVMKTANGDNPITAGVKPLIGIDVWEHAYYLDYQNRRPEYISIFLEKLINWEFAEKAYYQ